MGQESTHNQSNMTIMGTNPTERYNFDVYRAEILRDGGYYELEMSNVISWELFGAKMTREELKGLADFIYKYLENK
jgi:hypothetical protein